MAYRILRLPAVVVVTGISRSSIYVLMERGSFPRPVKLSERCVGWVESEVQEWISEKVDRSRRADPKAI
jgi:prophage regulatory protein